MLAVVGFSFAGIASLSLAAILIEAIDSYFWAILISAIGAVLFWGANLFGKERKIDPFRNFLTNPEHFEFVEGQLVSASYSYNGNSRNSRMIVKGEAKTKEEAPLLFFEFFDPNIWPFVEAGEEDNLTPGDDWYELRGQRKTLPVPIYVLYHKKTNQASMVGIDHHVLSSATKVIE